MSIGVVVAKFPVLELVSKTELPFDKQDYGLEENINMPRLIF